MMYCVPETETKSCIVWFQFTKNKDANRINNLEVAPVSYTHLDVYKRQDESLFASEKQRFPRMCKIGVAIIAAEAFRGMGLMVENHPPPRTTSIEDQRNVTCCLHLPRRQKRPKEHNQSGHESRQEGDLGLHDSPPLRVENTVVDLGNA